jgi:hypothetical protein
MEPVTVEPAMETARVKTAPVKPSKSAAMEPATVEPAAASTMEPASASAMWTSISDA